MLGPNGEYEEQWSDAERSAADALLKVLRARGGRECEAARLERGKANVTENTWPWSTNGPDIAAEVAAAVADLEAREALPLSPSQQNCGDFEVL